jgi:hypothetical protein
MTTTTTSKQQLNPQEFSYKNLETKSIPELKFICKQLNLSFIIKNKKKNIASIIKYSKQHILNINKKYCILNDDDILLVSCIEKTFSDSFDETWD